MEHTYLYHITRQDVKHNFSVYFYPLYLLHGTELSAVVGLLAFAPQALLLAVIGWRFRASVEYAAFLQTVIFVAFNKVYTSQARWTETSFIRFPHEDVYLPLPRATS